MAMMQFGVSCVYRDRPRLCRTHRIQNIAHSKYCLVVAGLCLIQYQFWKYSASLVRGVEVS